MNEEQEIPPEVDAGTHVVWPTCPEDAKEDEEDKTFTKIGNSEEIQPSTSYSYWFGEEMSEDHDNSSEIDKSQMEQKTSPSKRNCQRKESDEEDPDWSEELGGVILSKKRTKIQGNPELQKTQKPTGISQPGNADGAKQFSRFRFSWTADFYWLHYDAKFKLMFCRVCQQAGKKGYFATQGCGDFNKLTLRMHDVSKEHISAAHVVKRLTGGQTADVYANTEMTPEDPSGIDEGDDVEAQNSLYSDAALLVALRTAYYAAQQCSDRSPTQVYNSMMALQDSCNVLGAKELRLGTQPQQCSVLDSTGLGEDAQVPEYAFGDDESLAEMHDVLARILQEDLYNKIGQSDFIAVVIQECPDADLQPLQMQLIIHARYTLKGKVFVGFLATILVSKDKPGETVSGVIRVLEECELPVDKVVAIQILCPKKNGKLVTTSDIHHWHLAKGFVDQGIRIVLISAHKHPPWNMCLSLAAQKLEEGTKYQHMLGRLVLYLQSISTKLQGIDSLKVLVNDPLCQWDGLQMPAWLMVQKTAKTVCLTWPTLIEVLETEATSQSDTQAKQLLDELQKYQFLAFVHLLLDIVPIIKDTEMQLNSRTADDTFQHITSALSNLQEHSGENEQRFSKGLDLQKKTFCNHRVYFSDQQRDRADQMRSDFIQNVGKQIEARCAVLEKMTIRRAFCILNPKTIASLKDSELGEFGRNQLQVLTTAFLDVSSDKDCFPEYQEMKMILYKHHKDDSIKTASEQIGTGKNQFQAPIALNGAERCPHIVKLLHCAVTIPGVCAKTDYEVAGMLKVSLDFMEKYGSEATTLSRMMIANYGQKLNTFDFIAALQEWNSV